MKIRLLTLLLAVLPCLANAGKNHTIRETLLQDYFDTTAVCSTADVTSIIDVGSTVTIDLKIEPITNRGLVKLVPEARDDWFSLHCPPEFHPVWLTGDEQKDIHVQGILADSTVHLLSCTQYQKQLYQRMSDAKASAEIRLKKLLDR